MALKIKLKANERIIVNGAVIVARKKPIELIFLNRARILREDDILVEEHIRDAITYNGWYRNDSWFYYLIQLFYIDPDSAGGLQSQLADTVTLLRGQFPEKNHEIDEILGLMADGYPYRALKECRKAFPGCLSPRQISKVLHPMPNPHSAYDRRPSPDDPRQVEAWGLLKAAERLDSARRDPNDDDELRESLRINQVLWTIIQSAVSAPDTELPPELRDNILTLSILVDEQTYACLGDLDREKVSFLVEVNRHLAMGLMENPGREAGEAGEAGKPVERGSPPKTENRMIS